MAGVLVEIAGWIGAFVVVAAYCCLTMGRCDSRGLAYQAANFAGALLVLLNAAWHSAWPPLVVNAFWGLIALSALVRIGRLRPSAKEGNV